MRGHRANCVPARLGEGAPAGLLAQHGIVGTQAGQFAADERLCGTVDLRHDIGRRALRVDREVIVSVRADQITGAGRELRSKLGESARRRDQCHQTIAPHAPG